MRRLSAALVVICLLTSSMRLARAGSPGVPLESLPLIGGSACVISPACPGKAQGAALAHGLHIDGSTDAEIKLGKRYTSLGGTIYLDDSSTSLSLPLSIYDTTGGTRRLLYQVNSFYVTGRQYSFAIGVQGVDSLTVLPQNLGDAIDIVAYLAPAAGTAPRAQPTAQPAPGTAPTSGPVVATVLPGANVTLTGVPSIPFAWTKYPGTAEYLLQVWLARAATGQKITAQSRLNVAAATAALHYELSTAGMPKGTYHWRIAAMTAQGTLIAGWTPEGSVTIG